jgi:cell division protein ZapE
VLISDVPVMDWQMENQARRFINLVDAFYDHSVKLIISAAAPVAELYQGNKLQFDYQRTLSRLLEMQSQAYLAREHLP